MTDVLTPTVDSKDTLSPDRIGELAAALGEPEWLAAARRTALESYLSAALPSRVTHLWRYTNPEEFVPQNGDLFHVQRPQSGRSFPEFVGPVSRQGSIAGAAYTYNGSVHRVELNDELRRAGVIVCDLHTAARDYPDLVRDRIGAIVAPGFGKFEALASAVWQGGLFVYVPKGIEFKGAIHLISEATQDLSFLSQRFLIVVDENASLSLICENYGGPPANGHTTRTNSVAEIFAAQSARVNFTKIQRWNEGVINTSTWRARLESSARMDAVSVSAGGKLSKSDGGTILSGRGAESNFYGVSYAHNRQHHDAHTVHEHESSDTRSDLKFKVALSGRANSAYTGLIRIAKDAPRCEAYQENRNLLLSKKARAETIPELEILNDDVRCSHGATVGKIDPDEVFYLVSRGLTPAEATQLIVGGFAEPILQHAPAHLRDRLSELLLAHVGAA